MKMNSLVASLMSTVWSAFGVILKDASQNSTVLTDDKFILHLKESEARFNHRDGDFAAFIAKLLFKKIKKDTDL